MQPGRQGGMNNMQQNLDLNGDGYISPEERTLCAVADLNNDGHTSRQELNTVQGMAMQANAGMGMHRPHNPGIIY